MHACRAYVLCKAEFQVYQLYYWKTQEDAIHVEYMRGRLYGIL